MRKLGLPSAYFTLGSVLLSAGFSVQAATLLPDTGQNACYNGMSEMSCPTRDSEIFYGQDAQHAGNSMSFTANNDGTVTDNVTGLIWQQTADSNGDGSINASDKMTYSAAQTYCENLSLAGADDWRLPTIKQLYSLIDFSGADISGYTGTDTSSLNPFINTRYFAFNYGDLSANERLIDSQYASSTLYVSRTANDGGGTLFGVNFADGRIKGYGLSIAGKDKTFFVMCTRGNADYGTNSFTDNNDDTITDSATGLMWAKNDSMETRDWIGALDWVVQKNKENYLGHSDWRLPNIKELQSLVDYSRSPDTSNSAAIDPIFNSTSITNEAGNPDYAYYWSSTTHPTYGDITGGNAAYISFGRAIGYLDNVWQDVHGAGAQRSDPKGGDASEYPKSHGPQGDAQRLMNYLRLVRDTEITTDGGSTDGSTTDGGTTDGGSTDGGTTDGGTTDGGTTDGGSTDGGTTDGGTTDGGTTDGGTTDGGTTDGGTTDGSSTDGGSTDNGTTDNSNAAPAFDGQTGLLHLPVINAGTLGLYQAKLRFAGVDPRYNPGFLFELTELDIANGSAIATYDPNTAKLSVPSISVDGVTYKAELEQIPDATSGMWFAVSMFE